MKHHRPNLLLFALAVAWLSAVAASAKDARMAGENSVHTHSEIFTMADVYKSMFGPTDSDPVQLPIDEAGTPAGPPEIYWITGIRADIVGPDGLEQSPEYFCHSNFNIVSSQPVNRRRLLGIARPNRNKMFTLVQGQNEIRFPEGFGMPVLSNDQFVSNVMVMNPTASPEPIRVGVDSRIDYVRDSELSEPMKPLYVISLPLRVPVASSSDALLAEEHTGDESCLDGEPHAQQAVSVDRESIGRRTALTQSDAGTTETGHWYVPPGRHVYRHVLPPLDKRIPAPTRAHYIAAHLHPFGESIELIDRTLGESIFKAESKNYPDRIAIENITHYSSSEGIPIDPSHEYELVAIYDNTSDTEIDSMAVVYLYLYDERVRPRPVERRAS